MEVLAIDIGTSSVRFARFDAVGELLGPVVQRTHRQRTLADGTAEFAPAGLWQTCADGLDEILAGGHRPMALGISCFWHGLLGCTTAGHPLTPVWTWADSRAAGAAAGLRRRFDETAWHRRTGCMLRTSFWPAKLAWARRTYPDLRHCPRWCGPAEWLQWRLTGTWRSAHGMATATGLYDPAACDWDDGLLAACRVSREALPGIDDRPLALAPRWARRWPGLRATAIHPAIGDGAAANLGAGATAPGTAAVTMGTTAAVRLVRSGPRPVAPSGLFCYRIDRSRHLIGGAVSNAGSLHAWCCEHLRLPDADGIEQLLAAQPGPPAGLAVIPRWLAERAPDWRDDLSGAVLGLTQATSASDLYRAITAAGYLRLARIIDQLPGPSPRLIVGGGMVGSPAALRRLAACLGQPLHPAGHAETSLRGAAVLVLERLGLEPAHPLAPAVVPDPALVRSWRNQRRRQEHLDRLLDQPQGNSR